MEFKFYFFNGMGGGRETGNQFGVALSVHLSRLVVDLRPVHTGHPMRIEGSSEKNGTSLIIIMCN